MAGPIKANRNLANLVRKIGLEEILDVLENRKDYGQDFRKQLLLKLTPTLLPRINEHSGPDGKELPTPIMQFNGILPNLSDQQNSEPEQTA